MTPDASLWLRVSPKGKQAGTLSVPDGIGGHIHFLVLPKLWSSGRRCIRAEHTPGATSVVTVHELDTIELVSRRDTLGAIMLAVTAVDQPGERQLIDIQRPDTKVSPEPASAEQHNLAPLINMLLLARRAGIRRIEAPFKTAEQRTLLRVLNQERFVSAVEPVLFRARPVYREFIEELGSPRGRVSDMSVVLAAQMGSPLVECAFDELTMDSPLLRVVLAALTVVASDRVPQEVESLVPRLRARATLLCRYLATVTPIARHVALQEANSIYLSPANQHWQAALESAGDVLRGRSVDLAGTNAGTSGVGVHIATEKLWELIVEKALSGHVSDLRVSSDNFAAEGVRVLQPWIGATGPKSESYPDFMFRARGKVVVADAKYKRSLGRISAADGYQLFSYSHLSALEEEPPHSAMIMFPYGSRRPKPSLANRAPNGDMQILLAYLRFPTDQDIQTLFAWSNYLSTVRHQLDHQLGMLSFGRTLAAS
jgi:5-methylcytosine-specific restriction endonuclease McrBC regulatory subunit McrC